MAEDIQIKYTQLKITDLCAMQNRSGAGVEFIATEATLSFASHSFQDVIKLMLTSFSLQLYESGPISPRCLRLKLQWNPSHVKRAKDLRSIKEKTTCVEEALGCLGLDSFEKVVIA